MTIWHGRADRLVPLDHTLALAAAIPGSTTRVDPRGGHFCYSRRLAEIMNSLRPAPVTPAAQQELEPAAVLRAA